MTIGKSKLVEEFFKKAAASRAFDVIVAEGGPFLSVSMRLILRQTQNKIEEYERKESANDCRAMKWL